MKEIFHYKESGFNNVYLLNGYTYKPDGANTVKIEEVNKLIATIAMTVVLTEKFLTPNEFKTIRELMKLNTVNLAKLFNESFVAIDNWESCKVRIPYLADLALRSLYLESIGLPMYVKLYSTLSKGEYENCSYNFICDIKNGIWTVNTVKKLYL